MVFLACSFSPIRKTLLSPPELSNRVYFETPLNRAVDQVTHALSNFPAPDDALASGKVGLLEFSSPGPQGALEVKACCLWDTRPLASAQTPAGHAQDLSKEDCVLFSSDSQTS